MIKIPLTEIPGDRFTEVWKYLDANCITAGVLAHWSPNRDKRMYSLITEYGKSWNVTRYRDYIEVIAHPAEHETFLALKYGVK